MAGLPGAGRASGLALIQRRGLAIQPTGKLRTVVVMQERQDRTLLFVFRSEDESLPTIAEPAMPGTTIYANEAACREDHRRVPNGDQYLLVAGAAMAHAVSLQRKGYWHRSAI